MSGTQLGFVWLSASTTKSFALGVVEPEASGIGGDGMAILYLKGMEEPPNLTQTIAIGWAGRSTAGRASGSAMHPGGMLCPPTLSAALHTRSDERLSSAERLPTLALEVRPSRVHPWLLPP
jgi:hypothetical protein